MTREALRNRPDLWPKPDLKVVNADGELLDSCPGCRSRDEAIAALQGELTYTLMRMGRVRAEHHEELGLRPDAEAVKRVYAEWRRLCAPKAHGHISPDRLKMGLARLKTFSEGELVTAVTRAAAEKPDRNGRRWDKWENVMRNDGAVYRHLDEGRVAEGLVVQDRELARLCDCGHPNIDHQKPMHNPAGLAPCGHRDCSCVTFDDIFTRSDEWLARRVS